MSRHLADPAALVASYRRLGSYRAAAAECGACWATVRRAVLEAEAGSVARPAAPAPPRRNIVQADRPYKRVAFLSDLHHPFHDKAAIRVALACLRDFRPDLIVIGGDYFDCFSISDHSREPGRMDYLQDEFDSARDTSGELEDVAARCRSRVVFIAGNHEERLDRLRTRIPAFHKLRALDFPRVAELPKRWQYLPNQARYRIGSLSLHHGDLRMRGTASVNPATGMLRKLRTSSVFGHLHRFQSSFETTDDGTYRGAYAIGHLCDVEQAHYITNPDWQQGFALIEFDHPTGIFKVSPQMIVNGCLINHGKTYGNRRAA